MARFHFLNVKNGDCSIIEHDSGRVSMIDVCNARLPRNVVQASHLDELLLIMETAELAKSTRAPKNYRQKMYPENPIEYLREVDISEIFRLIITHPDMDHMDGLADLFDSIYKPINYYDTDNEKEMSEDWENAPFRRIDWEMYKNLRDNPLNSNPKCLRVYSPHDGGAYRTLDEYGKPPGDSFYTLSPTRELLIEANRKDEYNDASYVFLYFSPAGRILLSGDSHDNTWEYILSEHEDLVKDVDLLIAPHHGRKSGRSYEFLDVVNPKMTFFGNAPSKDLAYNHWRYRELEYITNNMAGSMIVDCNDSMALYVTNKEYAMDVNSQPEYRYFGLKQVWYVKDI